MPQKSRSMRTVVAAVVAALLGMSGLFTASAAHAVSPTEIVLEFVVTPDEEYAGGNAIRGQVGLGGDLAGVTINWGDTASGSNVTTVPNGTGVASQFYAHSFSAAGTYTVTVSGTTLTQFGHCDIPFNTANLRRIISWTSDTLTSLRCMAANRLALTAVPSTLPGEITDLSKAFLFAESFNQNISTWDTSHVTTTNSMFDTATVFNNGGQPLTWTTSQVTDMAYMFIGAIAFNQPITFDTSHVQWFNEMFRFAAAFNQNLGGWNITASTEFDGMFDTSGLDDTNYSNTLIGWSAQSVQANAELGAPGKRAVGCAAVAARQTLVDAPNNWVITDAAPQLPAGGCSGGGSSDGSALASTGGNTLSVLVFALGGIGLGIIVLLVIFIVRRRKL